MSTATDRLGRLAPRGSRRWRLGRILLYALGALVLLRIALAAAVPLALYRAAKSQGLACDWEQFDLSVLSGEVELWNFDLRPREGSTGTDEPTAHLEYAKLDVHVLALLLLRLDLRRAEIDGLDVVVERDAGGTWKLAGSVDVAQLVRKLREKPVPAERASEPAPVATAEAPGEPAPFDLSLPLTAHALRLQHARVRILDPAANPPLDATLAFTSRISDLGSETRPTRVEMFAYAPGLLESLEVEGRLVEGPRALSANLEIRVAGLRLSPLSSYLEPLGIAPRSERVDCALRLGAELEVRGERANEVHGQIELNDAHVLAGGVEALALDHAAIDLDAWTRRGAVVPTIGVRGLRAKVEHLADGRMSACGLDVDLPVLTESLNALAAANEDEAPPSGPAFPLKIDACDASELALSLTDRAFDPPAVLSLELEELALKHFDSDPAHISDPIEIQARVRAPGVAESIELGGSCAPFGPEKTVELSFASTGIAPAALNPYLREYGLESDLEAGSFACRLTGRGRTDAQGQSSGSIALEEIRFADAAEIFGLERVSASAIAVDPAAASVRVEELEIRGTRAIARRDRDGVLHALGLRTAPIGARPASPAADPARAAPAASSSAPAPAPSPRFEIGRFAWVESALSFSDETFDPPSSVVFDDLGLEIEGLALGGDPALHQSSTATLRAWFAGAGLAERLELAGTIESAPGPLAIQLALALDGRGLATERVKPYLVAAGIEPELEQGTLHLDLGAKIADADGELRADVALEHVTFAKAGEPLLSLEVLRVEGARFGTTGLRVEGIDVSGVRLSAGRDADGAFRALGVRVPQRPSPPSESALLATLSETLVRLPLLIPILELGPIHVDDVQLAWHDVAVEPNVTTALSLSANADGLVFGRAAEQGTFAITVRVPDALDRFLITGNASLDPDDVRIKTLVAGGGLRAGPLEPYLPPGTRFELEDGRFELSLELELARVAEGGRSARVMLSKVELRDGDKGGEGPPLFQLASARVEASRIDPANGVFELGEISAAGLELGVHRAADGALHALGFRLDANAPANSAHAQVAPEPSGAEAVVAARRPERDRGERPRVSLERLDLELARLSFTDAAWGQASVPLELALRLSSRAPLVLLDREPESLAPLQLALEGALRPLVGGFRAELELAPFAAQPSLEAKLSAHGLHGAGVTELAPALSTWLDGRELEDGRAAAHVHVELSPEGGAPGGLDPARPFGLALAVDGIELLATPEGEKLAGLGALRVDAPRIDPVSGSAQIQSIEIERPYMRIRRASDGVHVLGFTIDPLALPKSSKEAGATASAPAPHEPTESRANAASPAERAEPEVRVDTLAVRGLDFELRDDSVEPPLVLPLDDLDLEVKRFTTRAFREPVALRFSAYLGAGTVELPQRDTSSSVLEGLASAAGDVIAGARTQYAREERDAFQELALTGRVSFFPSFSGYAQVNLSALELLNLAGEARTSGVAIGDGLLDSSVRLRFRDADTISVDTTLVFSDLSLSESAGGPVEKYLTLPAPLDTVLFLLKNADGEHRIPLSFTLRQGEISTGEIARAAVGAAGIVIATAIASAPLRMLGSITGLFGSGEEEPPARDTFELGCAGGTSELDSSAAETLAKLRERLRSDSSRAVLLEHRFCRADLERAALLANPSEESCLDLTARLRQRRDELSRQRGELSAEARALYAVGRAEQAASSTTSLRAIEAELGHTERSLDLVLAMLNPGAERYRDKRTRNAALELARARLAALRKALESGGVAADRIEEREPRFDLLASDEKIGAIVATMHKR